jgi:hypothetical protein
MTIRLNAAHPLRRLCDVLRNTRAVRKRARPFAQPLATRHDAAVAPPQRSLPLGALAA